MRTDAGRSVAYDGELLAAVTMSTAPAAHALQARGDQPEHLVAGLVPVGVVELLEVVHVEHRDGAGRAFQPLHLLVQRAAPAGLAGRSSRKAMWKVEQHRRHWQQHRRELSTGKAIG